MVRLKILILPLSAIVVIYLSVFVVKPAFSEMIKAKESLKEGKSQLEELRDQNRKLSKIKSDWESMEDKNLVLASLPKEEDVEHFVSELYQKVNRSGVLLESVELGENKSASSDGDSLSYVCGSNEGITETESSSSPAVATDSQPTAVGPADGSSDVALPDAGETPMVGDGEALPAATSLSCVKAKNITVSINGSWEQVINFFEFLEDMNRVSNIKNVSISSSGDTSGQSSEGESAEGETPVSSETMLSVDVSIDIYYKGENKTGISSLAASLAQKGGLSKEIIKKLKDEIVFTPYTAPNVSESGERNPFKP